MEARPNSESKEFESEFQNWWDQHKRQQDEISCMQCGLPRNEPKATCVLCNHAGSLTSTGVPRFALFEELGRGSYGQVYLADDARLDRSVAIKILRPGLNRQFLLHEARKAAGLSHENIATIYDVVDGDSVAMICEYVEGLTLDDYLHVNEIELDQAVRLTSDLAAAVAHGNRQGVFHCDISLRNVIVQVRSDDSLHVSLIDFGIANRRGASPRIDIVALGDLLSKLLQKVKPEDGVWNRLCAPVRRRQLGKIVQRTQFGYANSLQLREDLDNWLRSEPTTNGRTSFAARILLWLHKSPVIASLLTLTFTVLFALAIMFWSFSNISRALADRENQRADYLSEATEVFKSDWKGNTSIENLKSRMLTLLERFAHESGKPEDLARSADLQITIGSLSKLQGNLLDARAHYESARTTLQELFDESQDDLEVGSDLAGVLNNMAIMMEEQADFEEAIDLFQEALQIRQVLLKIAPDNEKNQRQIGIAYTNLANVFQKKENVEPARKNYQKAIELQNAYVNDFVEQDAYLARLDLCRTLDAYASLLQFEGNNEQAEELYLKAISLGEEAFTLEKEDAIVFDSLSRVCMNAAICCSVSGNLEQARSRLERAVDISRQLVSSRPLVPAYQLQLAFALAHLGAVARKMNDLACANDVLQESIRMLEEQVSLYGGGPEVQVQLAGACNAMSAVMGVRRKFDKASEYLERSNDINNSLFERFPNRIGFKIKATIGCYNGVQLQIERKDFVTEEAIRRLDQRYRDLMVGFDSLNKTGNQRAASIVEQMTNQSLTRVNMLGQDGRLRVAILIANRLSSTKLNQIQLRRLSRSLANLRTESGRQALQNSGLEDFQTLAERSEGLLMNVFQRFLATNPPKQQLDKISEDKSFDGVSKLPAWEKLLQDHSAAQGN